MVSVIIPVKNGEKTLDRCLSALFSQTVANKMEVIIIDSGSTDNTFQILAKYPVRLYQIKPEEFSHSKTRNYGVSLANGEFIVMTVQDAYPIDKHCIEYALEHFKDPEVVAVAGRQLVLPNKDINPLAWHTKPFKSFWKTIQFSKDDFFKISKREIFDLIPIDDVCAIYRKQALLQLPFPDTDFGEDKLWGLLALEKGWKIVFDSRVAVHHYHHYDLKWFIQRRKNIFLLEKKFGINNHKLFPLRKLFSIFYHCFFSGRVKQKKFYWFWYNLRNWMLHNILSLYYRFFKRVKKAKS